MSSDLRLWVNDSLHDVAQISDMTIADFFIGLAQKSSSSDELVQKIKDTDTLDINPKVTQFANDLFNKIPKTSSIKAGDKRKLENRAKEKAALELAAKNRSYKLLSDEEDEPDLKIKPKKSKKEKKSKKKAEKYSDSEDEFEKMERERRKDLEERDAFAQRMIKKDKEKQRNVNEKSEKKAYEEAAKRLAMENENKEQLLPDLRKESRRKYLAKRKEDKILELKDDIADDEFLFDDSQLTEKEKQERKYKKTVLNLALDHTKASEIEKVQRYVMPEDRKKGETDSYIEVENKERAPHYEQKKWEEEHLNSATYKFGAKDAKRKYEEKAKKYDLILDDEIDFIQALKMPGTKDEKGEEKEEMSDYQKKKMTIEETKKSLPVYPFKQSLLEAIDEHQVLIIEGMTLI